MEPEKKRRQKKKKNKQGKANESVSAGVGELTSENNNHVNVTKQNHQNLNSETADVQNKGLQNSVVDSDRPPINGAETSRSVEAEKSYWLNRDAPLEQKIKELQEQLDVHVQREADLERNVSQSQKERNLWHHKEAELETRTLHLQTEKDSWLQKEAGYEEKINWLVEETATLRSMRVSIEEELTQMEEEKVNLAQRENLAAETIASLNKDNARLRAQVIELEASRNDISHQNQQLKEHVSDLQSKIQALENSVATRLSSERTMHVTENEDVNSQLESAHALVEKLLSENEKLVEKVNNLNGELDQKSVTTQSSLPIKPDDPIVRNPKAAGIDESSTPGTDRMPSSAERPETVSKVGPSSGSKEGMLSDKIMESLKDEVIRLKSNRVNHTNSEGSDFNQISRVSMESGEIVQIPLDENDVTVPTSTTSPVPEKANVALTEAPLIGAPFRLISFVARYVSGADLVQR